MSALRCCDCGEVRASEELLASHISNDHLLWIPYECVYCSANDCITRKASESELVKHIKERHPGKDIKTLFLHDEKQKSLLQHKIQLSKENQGDRPPNSVAPQTPNPIKSEEVITINDEDRLKSIGIFPPSIITAITAAHNSGNPTPTVTATPTAIQNLPIGILPSEKIPAPSRKDYNAGYCNPCKRQYSVIRAHLRQKHLSSGVYKCSHCKYNTATKTSIQSHICKPHQGEGQVHMIERSKDDVLVEVKRLEQTITSK